MATNWRRTLNDINFVAYFLLNFSPAAIESTPDSKTKVVSTAKVMINIIIIANSIFSH